MLWKAKALSQHCLYVSLPYIFRLRQCIAEYLLTPASAPHHAGHSHAPSIFVAPSSAASTPASPKTRALFNALKYATAFPVIILSALQGKFGDPHGHTVPDKVILTHAWMSPNTIFRVWGLSVLVNSLFSFWWDITNDWGLHLLLPSRLKASTSNNTVLRRILLLPDPTIYYLIILLDLILRFTWSLKLSSHLHSIHEIEMGIFLLEALEVTRRWIWVYVRVEWEAVRKGGDSLEDRLRTHNLSDLHLPLLATPPGGSPQPSPMPQMSQHDTGSNVSAGLDRRVSASYRKTSSTKSGDKGSPYAAKGNAFQSSSHDDEMGLGKSGVLVDHPVRK